MLDKLNAAAFSEWIGTKFIVRNGAERVMELELCKVTEQNATPALEQFSLLFRGPFTPALSQSIAKLEHEGLGSMELFLTPVGPDGEGMCYEVVFNRFRKQAQSER
jgi:hypothetical protein